ncbi:hypothetical protein NFI96_019374, partial [Prochilodus magdalenae]
EREMAGAEGEAEAPRLSELLDGGWRLYEEVENTTEPSGSNPVQVKVKRGMKQLEEALTMVEQLHLFSRNEELDEIATADLKYLLLPAVLAALTLRQHDPQSFNSEQTRSAETTPTEEESDALVPVPRPQQPDLIAMATQRQAKIERFKQRKEAEAKLAEMRVAVDSGSADDEVLREFYLLQVRRWIAIAIEEVDSINQEIQILKRMDGFRQSPAPPAQPRRPPMKPFILTKDAVQARVFGAGYPSLPTMTVDDWYEQHRSKGCLPDQGLPQSTADVDAEEREREEKERREEEEDGEALQKARDWDNWKDTHRRGYGNRKNMG